MNQQIMSTLNVAKMEMNEVLLLAKADFDSVEAKAEREELKSLIQQQNGSTEDRELLKDLKCASSLTTIGFCRDWLFAYKGRGYVISDLGNQWMEYRCTVEEFLLSLTPNTEELEKNVG